jgi:hypothetical protein
MNPDSMRIRVPFLFFCGLFFSLWAPAQVAVTFPTPRAVFQRDAANRATVFVAGTYSLPVDRIEVRTRLSGTAALSTTWQLLQQAPKNGQFRGTVRLQGGWHQIEVRGVRRDTVVATTLLEPVGVGEVFLVAGQSNAMGIPNLGAKGSATDWVSVVNRLNKTYDEKQVLTISPDQPNPNPVFSRPTADSDIFPTGETPWFWGEFGDLLGSRLRVPVLIFNTGWAAATAENWSHSADSRPAYNMYVGKYWPNLQPYANFRNTLRDYHSQFGLRAVLWQHGESDAAHTNITKDAYQGYLQNIINRSRQHARHDLAWVVAYSSLTAARGGTYGPIRDAQRAITEVPGNGVFLGPDTDQVQNPRPAHGHFENIPGRTQGLSQAAQAWNQGLSDAFFTQSRPLQAPQFIQTGPVPGATVPGATLALYFESTLPADTARTYVAELLDGTGGYLSDLAAGKTAPLAVKLPAALASGAYQLRVRERASGLPGVPSGLFSVGPALAKTPVGEFQIAVGGRRVLTGWRAVADSTVSEFIVQRGRSQDELADWRTVRPVGTSGPAQVYELADAEPLDGFSNYRLKMVGRDGRVVYSEVRSAFVDPDPALFKVFPNPSVGQPIYVKLPALGTFRAQLFDVRGNELPCQLLDPTISGVYTLHPMPLPQGMYWLRVVTERTVLQRRIIVGGAKSIL